MLQPPYSRWKSRGTHWIGGPQSQARRGDENRIPAFTWNWNSAVQPVASHFTDWAVRTDWKSLYCHKVTWCRSIILNFCIAKFIQNLFTKNSSGMNGHAQRLVQHTCLVTLLTFWNCLLNNIQWNLYIRSRSFVFFTHYALI
jgi:hypothetical protein